jgi:hypothetical protein
VHTPWPINTQRLLLLLLLLPLLLLLLLLPLLSGEKLWRLPLNKGLSKKLDSPIADMKNYAGGHLQYQKMPDLPHCSLKL